MIAPLQTEREARSRVGSPRLAAARSAIAAILLRDAQSPAPPIPAWKAWLFIAWIVIVMVAYALSMLGAIGSVVG